MRARTKARAPVLLEEYVRDLTAVRLDRFAFELRRAAKRRDADSIHDLRVSIRRLSQCLKTFGRFFPKKEVVKIRRNLRGIMRLAAEVRNRDVAKQLLAKAGISPRTPLQQRLAQQRKQAETTLVGEIARVSRRSFSTRWRSRLGL